jgi:methyl-accepting chemotaxis protein
MAQMQALLKIKADVEGEGKVNALGRAIGGLSSTAGRVSGGLKGLAGAAGGLSGALGSLVPLATGAGLAAMAKGAIDAADNMNDLSQKTGVSVESLSKFQQAANASGTSIEGVGGAMLQFTKRFQSGAGPAADALKKISISATDASGKLKSTDTIMLEVADKFKNMEDGGKKAELAFALFGKAGADMIPMLNGGRKSIEDLAATMTGPFAKGADGLNDKLAELEGKLLILGVGIGTALMPLLNGIANAVLAAANAFAAMPGPLQAIVGGLVALTAAFVVLAPAISAVISIAGVLSGLQIGATIAGWAGAIGPAITAISAAFTGFLTFLTGTLLPGLIAFFSGPVGWTVLAVAAVVAMAILFRKPLQDFAGWLVSWGKPISQFFTDYITTPISKAWQSMVDFLPKALNVAATTIKNVFTGVGTAIKAVLNGVLRGVFGAVNGAIENINRLIRAANAIAAKVRGPQFNQLPTLNIPQFAKGGYVGQGTLAVVGEAGPEYIVPERKAAAFAMNYLNGARGGAAIPAFANGGFVGGNAQINVTTGPVMQQGGQQYVSMADLERAMRATANGVYASLRTPAGRYATGVR